MLSVCHWKAQGKVLLVFSLELFMKHYCDCLKHCHE